MNPIPTINNPYFLKTICKSEYIKEKVNEMQDDYEINIEKLLTIKNKRQLKTLSKWLEFSFEDGEVAWTIRKSLIRSGFITSKDSRRNEKLTNILDESENK